ncbi:MAG: MFS transporter [Thermodesulfobacteriota bacterium]|nr:MFS transporter [Thermodesulfobacteriota bacterium]
MENKKLYIACASMMPLMICSGMVYSVLALYISDLGASATQIGLVFMTGASAGAIMAPIFGKLSDTIGRRPVLLLSMLGFSIVFILYSLIENLMYVFPIQILEGATWVAFGTTATALIADIVPSEKRGWGIGIYDLTWNLGWIIGPALGGFLADTVGFRTTFLLSSMLIIFGLFIALSFVKETKKM